jgi:hypothetical protein
MQQNRRLIPSPALGVALLALVLAMSGAAVALPGKAGVKKDDIAKGAVTAKAIAKNAVQSKNIKSNAVTGAKVKNGTLTGSDVKDESLSSKKVSDYAVLSSSQGNFVRLTATDAVDEATARAAAPATVLFKKGVITLYGKCFRDTTANVLRAEIFAASSVNGSLLDGSDDQSGGAIADFLNPSTPETDRQVDTITASAATAELDESEFVIFGADGTHLLGSTMLGVKNGALAGGDGAYGPGNACLFGAAISG